MQCEKWNPSISLLRILSMFAIINCHYWEYVGVHAENLNISTGVGQVSVAVGNYFSTGVQIFLLMSGFLYGTRNKLQLFPHGRYSFIKKNIYKILFDYYVYVLLFVFPMYMMFLKNDLTVDRIIGFLSCSSFISGVVARRFCPCLAQDICQNLLPCFAA